MARILVIDDDSGVRESMARMLRGAGYTVLAAASGEEGFDLARGDAFDVDPVGHADARPVRPRRAAQAA